VVMVVGLLTQIVFVVAAVLYFTGPQCAAGKGRGRERGAQIRESDACVAREARA
jgi:hypothetical protein